MEFLLGLSFSFNIICSIMIFLLFKSEKRYIKIDNRAIYNPFFEEDFKESDFHE